MGDDVYGEDPTVNALEERVAEILGKDAAIYMSSGTMTNQVAVRTHTEPGDEILIDKNAHIYFYEAGGTAALSGVICSLISGERGVFGAKEMEAVISEKEPHTTIMRPVDLHLPRTKLVCLENTTNRGGGKVWPLEKLAEVENSVDIYVTSPFRKIIRSCNKFKSYSILILHVILIQSVSVFPRDLGHQWAQLWWAASIL